MRGTPPQSREYTKSGAALFALFVGAFSVGMAEFVIAGILPQVADAFRIDTGVVGLLVTVDALGVAIGGPVLTAATSKAGRKQVLLGSMVIFIAASIGSAVAPNYGALVVGRLGPLTDTY